MSIHPMAPLTQRIHIAAKRRGLPPRRPSSTQPWSWLSPLPGSPGPRPRPQPTGRSARWPRIGASVNLSGPPINWARTPLQALFESQPSVQVGLLAAPGLMRLGQPMGMSLNKISVIVRRDDDFRRRIRALDRDCYASCWQTAEGLLIEDDGFASWQLNTLPDLGEALAFQPVKARHRYLNVRLPLNCDYARFDRALTQALASARIDLWAATPFGQQHALRSGLKPEQLMRRTAYDYGGMAADVQRADEIIQIRPERETHILLMIIEELLFVLSGWKGPRC